MILNHLKIIFNKHKKYILACSFGPDSMALFNLLLKNKCVFIVAFVNYHKRPESNFEQKELVKYCQKNKIIYEILNIKKLPNKGNFQDWARKKRYNFFKKIYKKYNANGLFVAHQQDDLIETYLIQKKRNNYVNNYGIKKKTKIKGMIILRPLLSFTKNELLNYCDTNQIPYAIDKSNFDLKYLRNKIRHKIINNLTSFQRQKILKEIFKLNKNKKQIINKLFPKKKVINKLLIKKLITLKKKNFITIILFFLKKNLKKHINISNGKINEIHKMCLSKKPNIKILITNNIYLFKEYDELIINDNKFKKYSYKLKKPDKLITKEFEIDFSNGAEDRKIYLKDYPITIRSPLKNDILEIKNYKCKLNRVFIDWKMPKRYRNFWPIICNSNNKIIYVPRYQKKIINKQHKSKFLIKLN